MTLRKYKRKTNPMITPIHEIPSQYSKLGPLIQQIFDVMCDESLDIKEAGLILGLASNLFIECLRAQHAIMKKEQGAQLAPNAYAIAAKHFYDGMKEGMRATIETRDPD